MQVWTRILWLVKCSVPLDSPTTWPGEPFVISFLALHSHVVYLTELTCIHSSYSWKVLVCQAATLGNALPIWDFKVCLLLTWDFIRYQYYNALFHEANKLKLSFHILWKDKELLLFLQNHIKQKATATRVLLTLLNENQSIAVENTLGRTASIRGKERLKTSLLYNLGKECEIMGLKKGLIEG